jgi:propionyl-CoA carboxylase beta chain
MESKPPPQAGSKLAQRLQQAEAGASAGGILQNNLADLESMKNDAFQAGGAGRIADQHRRGKLTTRERIDLLLDDGSFEEFDILKTGRGGYTDSERRYPGDGVITGHGTIDGREVFVFSQDFTVIGGSPGEAHSQKISKVMDHAVRVGSPIIGLNDSGGARIQEGVDALAAYDEIWGRS